MNKRKQYLYRLNWMKKIYIYKTVQYAQLWSSSVSIDYMIKHQRWFY